MQDQIQELKELQSKRQASIKSSTAIMNAARAFVRRSAGFDVTNDEKDRAKQIKISDDIVKAIASGEQSKYPELQEVVTPFVAIQLSYNASHEAFRKPLEKRMVEIAKTLPAYEWAQGVRGFGDLSFATIVGIAGDLNLYANPAKLWKRFGLAVVDGAAQGKLPEFIKGKDAQREAWIERGYSKIRRSVMWVIGDCLVKGNRDQKYRAEYDRRKEYETARGEELTKSKMHAHRKAQRYIEKLLLRDMWCEWTGNEAG